MIIAIVLVVLVLATWVYTSYLSWKLEQGKVFEPIESSDFVTRWEWLARLVRRGWYSASVEGKKALNWSGKQAETAITKVFPQSAAAFEKHDELKGLETGPSSYFLKQITPEESKKSRSPRVKKDAKINHQTSTIEGTPE